MPLGYKYVQREATDYVNWAEIGKNMSDMLQNENKIREEKKAAIDEDSRQIGLTLANAPQGQDDNARKAALLLADNATQYKNLQLKLLKSGKLKLKDYLINTQNLKDSIAQSFDALTEYQKVYGEKMDRYRTGVSSKMEVDDMATVEGYGDWNKSGFYINPTNGIVNVALKEKKMIDGKEVYTMSENPNQFASPNYIKGLLQGKKDRLDVQKISDDWSSRMGTYIKSDAAKSVAAGIFRQGQSVTINDITSRKDFLKLSSGQQKEIFDFYNAENQWIDSQLSNPYARGSVLIDHLQVEPTTQKMYRRTHDKADAAANPEAIYEEINPSTQQSTLIFSDKQKQDSNDFVRNMTRPKYNYEVKVQTTGQLQLQEPKEKKPDEEKPKEYAMSAWNQIFTANTPADKRVAIDNLLGTNRSLEAGLKGIDVGDGQITFTYLNKEKPPRTIFFDKNNITLGQWAKLGTEIHGIDDVSKVLKRAGGGDANALMNANQKDFSGVTGGRTEQNYAPVVMESIKTKITPGVIVEDDEEKTMNNLNNLIVNGNYTLSDLGMSIEGDETFGNTTIRINSGLVDSKGSPIKSAKIPINNEEQIASAPAAIASFISQYVNQDNAAKVYGPIKAQNPSTATTSPAANTLNASKRKKP
jgi:hypothetical protein